MENVDVEVIKDAFKTYKKLHTAKYGCVFRDKLIGFVFEKKITVEEVIEIFDTISDLDNIRKNNDENVKKLLFSAIENSCYNSRVLDTLYKWQYVK